MRGVGIILPTVLTLWILVVVFSFVSERIAQPINRSIRNLMLTTGLGPEGNAEIRDATVRKLTIDQQAEWKAAGNSEEWLGPHVRRSALERWWQRYRIAEWPVMDMVGLVVAIALVYVVGLLLGSYLGKRLYRKSEELLRRVPFFKQVYPSVKQMTDFLVGGGEKKVTFNRVVAVEYPRAGMWSVGLVTGATMRAIQETAGSECVTVFVPASPTPFTGWVVTVQRKDLIELPLSIDEALKFLISGGVIIPERQMLAVAAGPVVAGASGREGAAAEGGKSEGAGPDPR